MMEAIHTKDEIREAVYILYLYGLSLNIISDVMNLPDSLVDEIIDFMNEIYS